ncbi:hypothetical protein F8388_023508 [Cannabis sativa]|uniref:Uncharacterized protein n=1 Tax=Cannabis sativa TaxID=3483 RepID=A0A7J6GLL5_CANSA|nr:hypothetical protein F8388_023508 [Cannabis sativa]
MGAAYGTAESGVGVASMDYEVGAGHEVDRPSDYGRSFSGLVGLSTGMAIGIVGDVGVGIYILFSFLPPKFRA